MAIRCIAHIISDYGTGKHPINSQPKFSVGSPGTQDYAFPTCIKNGKAISRKKKAN
jgi:hypothetical protein